MQPHEDSTYFPYWFDHEIAGAGRIRLGVSAHFLESLDPDKEQADILGLEILAEGTTLQAGDAFGLLRISDRAVDLRTPFALTIVARNADVLADPRLLRDSPYHRGWLIDVIRKL